IVSLAIPNPALQERTTSCALIRCSAGFQCVDDECGNGSCVPNVKLTARGEEKKCILKGCRLRVDERRRIGKRQSSEEAESQYH
ncbi:4225_t:CDS:2, partial [Ambispora gerdemannii]